MPSCRAFMLWILMLTLPMQGFAAVTMAICAAFKPVAAVAVLAEQPAHHAHAGGHDDSGSQAIDHAAQADAHTAAHGDSSGHDTGHQCGNCGACHVTGLVDSALPAAAHPLPQGRVADHLDPMASVAPHPLDKPPRA